MNWSSLSPPARKNSERSSKSSNSFSRIGMMWPGTFSRTSGFSREPRRPRPVVGAVGSIEPRNISKPRQVSAFSAGGDPPVGGLGRRHVRVLGDGAALGLELQPGLGPAEQPTLDRVGVPAGRRERIGRRRRAVAGAAVEDDRLVLVEAA